MKHRIKTREINESEIGIGHKIPISFENKKVKYLLVYWINRKNEETIISNGFGLSLVIKKGDTIEIAE